MRKWAQTTIEKLQPFDVILHASNVWVIQRIERDTIEHYRVFHVTRVDDGKQSRLTFSPFSHGYVVEKFHPSED